MPWATDLEAQEDCDRLCQGARALIQRFDLREAPDAVRDRPGWTAPVKIVSVHEGLRALIPLVAPDAELVIVADTSEVPDVIAGADVYFGRCTPRILEAGTELAWIQIDRAGAETCAEIPAVADRGILVTNFQRILAPAIAEHAIGLMMSLARSLPRYAVEQRAGAWTHPITDQSQPGFWSVEGKTMLILGLGGIGTEIARKANGLGMRVVATRNSSREGPDFVDYVGLAPEAIELAADADVVVNVTPLTDDTRGMFDTAFFNAMKETAYFINVGRGESVVTDDLVAALSSGAIAGAGLDVTDPEPLPPGHPLWTMPRVLLTPHMAGVTDGGSASRAGVLMLENLRRYVAGEPMLNVVDVRRGY